MQKERLLRKTIILWMLKGMADGFIKSIKTKEVPRNERYIGARSHSGGWMG